MEDRSNGKAKKANRLFVYCFVSVTVFIILLQWISFEHGLSGTFVTWRQLSGEEDRVFVSRVARCLHSKLASEKEQCVQAALSANNNTSEAAAALDAGASVFRDMEALQGELNLAKQRLSQSVTMLKLKDLTLPGQTRGSANWFMSTLHGTPQDGRIEEFRFPSNASLGRVLCLQGNHTTNGTRNSYGFAWKEYLPPNATFLQGLTLVADNYWDYRNPWHSMTALLSFASFRADNGCKVPDRLIAYHWGEVVPVLGDWVTNLLHASLGKRLKPETLNQVAGPVCFEDAVVHRRGLGGVNRQTLNQIFDMVRCQVYKFCKVVPKSYFTDSKDDKIDLTILARTGAREFRNLSGLSYTVEEQCRAVAGCQVNIVRIDNMTFCEQVELMSRTDILLTAHGAQLTNMMFMPKGGSVMEMFPKGWLENAGVGQYIYSWLAEWTRLHHAGVWRDTEGADCPKHLQTDRLKCFLLAFKDAPVGLNATHVSAWTADVLRNLQARRQNERNISDAGSNRVDAASLAASADCRCIENSHQ